MKARWTPERPATVRANSNGAKPLGTIQVRTLPLGTAKDVLVKNHYLHSLPAGTQLAFGVFSGSRLSGALTMGAGPANVYRMVEGAEASDCLTLTRLWLSDDLGKNSESMVIGQVLRALRQQTSLKFLVSYADHSQGHLGVIYQASNWLYTGLSQATPLYDLGDGVLKHSRTFSHAYGTRSLEHFKRHGLRITVVPQSPKHRYVYFLDRQWIGRLRSEVLPYPKEDPRD